MLVIMNGIKLLIIVAAILLFWTPDTLKATPIIEVDKTEKSVEKGKSFQIRLKILANERLTDVCIIPIQPEGFVISPIPQPIVRIRKQTEGTRAEEEYAYIDKLEPGSRITVAFKVSAPRIIDRPFKGISTRESKSFDFNISYRYLADGNEITGIQTVSTSVRYTTSMYVYLLCGWIGILLGHIVKVTTEGREGLKSRLKDKPVKKQTITFLHYIFVSNAVSLLTLLVIGFTVLLVLAIDQMPTKGWYDSIALGTGLAILGDDKLLSKLKARSSVQL